MYTSRVCWDSCRWRPARLSRSATQSTDYHGPAPRDTAGPKCIRRWAGRETIDSGVSARGYPLPRRTAVLESELPRRRSVAQLVEQRSPKPQVAGSNPAAPANTSPKDLAVSGFSVRRRFGIASKNHGRVRSENAVRGVWQFLIHLTARRRWPRPPASPAQRWSPRSVSASCFPTGSIVVDRGSTSGNSMQLTSGLPDLMVTTETGFDILRKTLFDILRKTLTKGDVRQ